VIYAPFYALFLVGPLALLYEDLVHWRITRRDIAHARQQHA
jgi:hypothetical protein